MSHPIERLNPAVRYADATGFCGLIHAVEVPAVEAGDIRAQTTSMLEQLETTLEKAGSGKDRLLMATLYLVDMADYEGMNEAWTAWLPTGCAPARACVQVVRLANPDWRVEIAVTAAQA
ncbi:RidA family protein [Candidatus Dactylopiibacterium carminicum]|uniref:RidA family protein n=1 Tax=Candidatus Dactylopiibacterium carminicum TaxID=857335 RepID=UPI001CC27949|nr:RidA family protein [Candidatus Dactylopiibacterium carminicum]